MNTKQIKNVIDAYFGTVPHQVTIKVLMNHSYELHITYTDFHARTQVAHDLMQLIPFCEIYTTRTYSDHTLLRELHRMMDSDMLVWVDSDDTPDTLRPIDITSLMEEQLSGRELSNITLHSA